MKSVSMRGHTDTLRGRLIGTLASAIASGALLCLACGCSSYEQPGENAAEGRRRHERVARINQQELMADIDTFFLTDKPSKLTKRRIP